jgi:Nickel/cobalt transporter regulator
MLRVFAFAVMLALAAPALALAEDHNQHHPPGKGPPPPHGGPPARAFVPHGPVGGPHVGGPGPGPGRQFSFHGHAFNPVHLAPFVYPRGWGYRRWAVGVVLPPIFLAPDYYYADWEGLGLSPPPPGFQWVRYGPDLLLVDVNTGQIADVAYGVFY